VAPRAGLLQGLTVMQQFRNVCEVKKRLV